MKYFFRSEIKGVFKGVRADRQHRAPSFSLIYEKVNKTEISQVYDKINIFTINKP